MRKEGRKKTMGAAPKGESEQTLSFDSQSKTDALGSYTGIAEDGSAPVQDADDL